MPWIVWCFSLGDVGHLDAASCPLTLLPSPSQITGWWGWVLLGVLSWLEQIPFGC